MPSAFKPFGRIALMGVSIITTMATLPTSQQTVQSKTSTHDSEGGGSENIPLSVEDLQTHTGSLGSQRPSRSLKSLESSESARVSRHRDETWTWLSRREPAQIPGQNFCRKCLSYRYSIPAAMFYGGIAIIVFLLILVITIPSALSGQKPNLTVENHVYTACPEAWIEFGNRCYYFSEEIRNWTFSDSNCTSKDANLVQIETQKELDFLKRYKDNFDYWIGSFNESLNHKGQWTDQTKCTAAALIAKGAGECPYLNKDKVNLDRIYIERRWICSQPKKNICSCHIPLNPS